MELRAVTYPQASPVDGYGPGFFRINDQVWRGNVFICGTDVLSWSGFTDPDLILKSAAVLDVIFIGTGQEITALPHAFRQTLESAGLALEFSATPAACRSYNVVLSEGRRIALAALST